MDKYTLGEWIAVGDWVELADDTRADICSVNPCDFGQGSYGRNDEEMRANAHLIAAAPDLLAALRNFVEFPQPWTDTERITFARAAIAKALAA